MTQDEIIEMGIQAGLCDEFGDINMEYDYKDQILAFAKLVAAKEREACALICDKEVEEWKYDPDVVDVAIAIRARGEA
jgi:hypothetical protein